MRCCCRAFEQVSYMIRFRFQKDHSGGKKGERDNSACGMESGLASENRRKGGNAVINLVPTSPWLEVRNLGSLLNASV